VRGKAPERLGKDRSLACAIGRRSLGKLCGSLGERSFLDFECAARRETWQSREEAGDFIGTGEILLVVLCLSLASPLSSLQVALRILRGSDTCPCPMPKGVVRK